ncbi:ATP-binding protein [Acidobacteriota bacterium]
MNSLFPGRSKRKLRKQILLFGISVLLPALVLLFFTLRLNHQDNELRKRRAEETKQQKAEEIGRHLAERLENIEKALLQDLSTNPSLAQNFESAYPEMVFFCRIISGELKMPWEVKESKDLPLKINPSKELILQAQQEEFSMNNIRRAEDLYNQALTLTDFPSQKIFILLQIGRLLSKSNDVDKAIQLYEEILSQPGNYTDEYGIPLTLYAADRLSVLSEKIDLITVRIEELLKEMGWLPSGALYVIRDIAAQIKEKTQNSSYMERAKTLELMLEERLEVLAKVQAMKSSVTAWMSQSPSSSQTGETITWESYGDIPWIVSIREGLEDGEPYLFSFHGPKVLSAVISESSLKGTYPGTCRIAKTLDSQGISLGGTLRYFRIQFDDTSISAWSNSSVPFPILYWFILFLVVGFTGFGMYLLWRDFNRELAVAEMKSHFASSVSHELKTPLTAIRMFAEALSMGVKKRPETQKDYLQTIISESERLSRLLSNVLDFSKIEQGTRTYRFDSISIEDAIEAAAKAMSFPLDQKGFKLKIEIEKGIPPVRADKDAIEQAVLNLLHNALKYSGESREIVLSLGHKDNAVSIDVLDYGIGISEDDKNRIFGKYYRVSGVENQRIPGTGLGLAIVSHIAEAHGGRIKVVSRPGEGSTFSIIIPLEMG